MLMQGSLAYPAPTYRSARIPAAIQAPFQNNQPWAFLNSIQLQVEHVFQKKHLIAV